MPKLTNEDNIIHAAYAVARDTSADNSGLPYWVADVIVYEVFDLHDNEQTSVSLAYYTPTRLSGTVQHVETLNSKYGPKVTLTPGNRAWNATAGQWGAEWEGYGFYALYNDTEPVDNIMTARDIDRIEIGGYGKNDIYAGTVTREAYIAGNGMYIDVDMGNGNIASIEITDKIYSVTTAQAQSDNWYGYNEATLLRYQTANNSQVKAGDKVIWVNDDDLKAAPIASTGTLNATKFVVDLGSTTWYSQIYAGADLMTDTPSWLINYTWNQTTGVVTVDAVAGTDAAASNQGEWQRIMYEQNGYSAPVDPLTRTITFTRGDVAATAAVSLTDQKLTEIFDDIKIGASATSLVSMTKNDTAGTFTYTYDANSAPALWYYELIFAPGFAATNMMKVGFTSTGADFNPSTAATGVFALNGIEDSVVIELVDNTVQYDEENVSSEQSGRIERTAKASIAEYVAAEIAKVTDADDKAILEANVNLDGSTLKTAIATANTAIETEVAKYPTTITTLEALQEAVDAVINTQKRLLDAALTEQVTDIDEARSAAASVLQSKYLGLVGQGKGDIVEDIYNNGVEAVNAALTTTAIETAKTAATTAMDEAVAKASVPAPLPAEEAKAAIDQWYSDPNGGGSFAGIATYLNWSLTPEADGTTINFAGKVEGTTNVYNADYFTAGGTIPGFTADSVPNDATKFIIVPLYFYENNGQVNTLRFILVSDSATVTSRTDVDPAYVGTYLLTYDWSNIEW